MREAAAEHLGSKTNKKRIELNIEEGDCEDVYDFDRVWKEGRKVSKTRTMDDNNLRVMRATQVVTTFASPSHLARSKRYTQHAKLRPSDIGLSQGRCSASKRPMMPEPDHDVEGAFSNNNSDIDKPSNDQTS